jgi:hypothetical protein
MPPYDWMKLAAALRLPTSQRPRPERCSTPGDAATHQFIGRDYQAAFSRSPNLNLVREVTLIAVLNRRLLANAPTGGIR